ncbi:MAG: DUF4432 family protein [Devosia sp.]|uniref:DUF4432 family protein n=1 Tax=Devosia sp. TaxID=1871048 RepID=UPI001AD53096|nr:DUF4432 family protein [Devosia sp.]MBN9314389.1 DUF4432 family protein [Devosia sp.]
MDATDEVVLQLSEAQFTARETPLAGYGDIAVTAFRYGTGIAAVRIRTGAGEVIVLPFHGQQIWDVRFGGRRLTMRSIFDEPQPGGYLDNYGAFLVHCGASAMGNPAPEDMHPLHGELPNAAFQSAELRFGTGGNGRYVTLAGVREERVAFSRHYTFTSSVRLGEEATRIGVEVAVRNLRHKPMELMYLAHVNFAPVDGSVIIDAVADEAAHFRVRRHLPIYANGSAAYRELMDLVANDPAQHRRVLAGRAIDPELVAGMDCVADADGWAHALQVLPDGTADFISHRPDQLPHAIRWITRNGDEDALGLVLPATAEVDGREAERRKGNVRMLAPGAEWRGELVFGVLDAAETRDMRDAIARLRA